MCMALGFYFRSNAEKWCTLDLNRGYTCAVHYSPKQFLDIQCTEMSLRGLNMNKFMFGWRRLTFAVSWYLDIAKKGAVFQFSAFLRNYFLFRILIYPMQIFNQMRTFKHFHKFVHSVKNLLHLWDIMDNFCRCTEP